MTITTVYCDCKDCEHMVGGRCGLDFITIDAYHDCLGYESYKVGKDDD